MTGPTATDLNIARAAGTLAAQSGDSRDSCLWESGPMRDAWLTAYDMHAGEPLHKVLPAGGPLHPAVAAMQPLDNDGHVLDLDDDTPLDAGKACDLSGDGTCEACQ